MTSKGNRMPCFKIKFLALIIRSAVLVKRFVTPVSIRATAESLSSLPEGAGKMPALQTGSVSTHYLQIANLQRVSLWC